MYQVQQYYRPPQQYYQVQQNYRSPQQYYQVQQYYRPPQQYYQIQPQQYYQVQQFYRPPQQYYQPQISNPAYTAAYYQIYNLPQSLYQVQTTPQANLYQYYRPGQLQYQLQARPAYTPSTLYQLQNFRFPYNQGFQPLGQSFGFQNLNPFLVASQGARPLYPQSFAFPTGFNLQNRQLASQGLSNSFNTNTAQTLSDAIVDQPLDLPVDYRQYSGYHPTSDVYKPSQSGNMPYYGGASNLYDISQYARSRITNGNQPLSALGFQVGNYGEFLTKVKSTF